MLFLKKLTKTDIETKGFIFQIGDGCDFFHLKFSPEGNYPPPITINIDRKPYELRMNHYGFQFELLEFRKYLQEKGAEADDILVLKKDPCRWGETRAGTTDDDWRRMREENVYPFYGPLQNADAQVVKKNDYGYDCYLKMINEEKNTKSSATVVADVSSINDGTSVNNDTSINDDTSVNDDTRHDRQNSKDTEQIIFYGAPGTGKSFEVKRMTDGKKTFRTTFHPDYDYANFVGTYKPALEGMADNKTVVEDQDGGKPTEKKLTYKFVPQVFAHAYVDAWDKYNPAGDSEHVYLIIEEINRGNCAQIFGDLFQLLDRNESGFSEYMVNADEDFKGYLEEVFNKNKDYETKIRKSGLIDNDKEFDFHWIWLPPNLSILATMNTSDQSLFPMDSAFKRRWDWKYVPIDYAQEEISQLKIKIGGALYSWRSFLGKINENIREITKSEDKQLGQFFIRPRHRTDDTIEFEDFRDKVIFYLWHEIYRDEIDSGNSIFGSSLFSELCSSADRGEGDIKKIIEDLHVEHAIGSPIDAADNDNEARETQAEAQEED